MVQEDGQPRAEHDPEQAGAQQNARGGSPAPSREQLMSTTSGERANALVLTVQGAVDGLTAPRLRTEIGQAFDRLDGRMLVVDLTDVHFLGSPGLHALTTSAREAVQMRGYKPLRIVVDATRPVIRPIERSGLDGFLELYHDVDEALRDD